MTFTEKMIHVDFNRPVADKPYSALYTLNVTVACGDGVSRDGVLELVFREKNARFRKEVALSETPVTFWLAIDTHLLPNGPNHVDVALKEAAGTVLQADGFVLNVLNDGPLADRVRESLLKSSAPLVFDGVVDSESFDTTDQSFVPWYDRPDAVQHVERLLKAGEITPLEAHDLRSLVTNGYVQLGEKIESETIAAANAAVDEVIATKYQNYEYGTSQRLEHLHEHYDAIRHIWKHPIVMRFLHLVFGVEALPCQTLTYVFGSEQDLHQDTVHLTSFPTGYMCGVWVALEDIQPDSGELMVVPGSHRFARVHRRTVGCPIVRDGDWSQFGATVVPKWSELFRESGLNVETYRPSAGTVLVWLDSLLHGGSKRVDKSLTRRSVVSHYFASGSLAYYDSTGLPGYVHR